MKTENLNEGFVNGKANVIENLNAEHCLLAELYWNTQYIENERLLDVDYVITRDGLKAINGGINYTSKIVAEWNNKQKYWKNYYREGEVNTKIEDLEKNGEIDETLSYIFSNILHHLFYSQDLFAFEDSKITGELDIDDYHSIKNLISLNDFLYHGLDGTDSYISSKVKRVDVEVYNHGHDGYYILDFNKIVESFKDFGDYFSEWFKKPLPQYICRSNSGNVEDYWFTTEHAGSKKILIRKVNRLEDGYDEDNIEYAEPPKIPTPVKQLREPYFK